MKPLDTKIDARSFLLGSAFVFRGQARAALAVRVVFEKLESQPELLEDAVLLRQIVTITAEMIRSLVAEAEKAADALEEIDSTELQQCLDGMPDPGDTYNVLVAELEGSLERRNVG